MTKVFFFFIVLSAVYGCSSHDNTAKNTQAEIDDPNNVSVTFQTSFSKSEFKNVQYFSFTVNKDDKGTSYMYLSDSAYRPKDSIMLIAKAIPKGSSLEYQTHIKTLRIEDSHDTLYLNDLQEKERGLAEHYQYILKDSFDLKINRDLLRIYCYKGLEEDIRWDNTMYFSNEYGMLLVEYDYFENTRELTHHFQMDPIKLKELISQIKREHNKTKIDA